MSELNLNCTTEDEIMGDDYISYTTMIANRIHLGTETSSSYLSSADIVILSL